MEKMGEYIKVIWTHVSWNGMHHRCYNLKHTSYPDYGGRGIEVCDRWHDEEGFENFIKDVGLRSERALSIDRINVNGNYEPTNCRWSSIEQQANNRRDNHFIIVDGEKGTIAEMSRRYNMHVERIGNRLKRGWTPEEACKIPIGQKRKNDVILTYNGVSKRLSYYAKEFGIEFSTLRHRLNVGWTVENALTTPTKNIFTAFGEQANLSQFCEKFNISKSAVQERLREGWDIEKALITPIKIVRTFTVNGETGNLGKLSKKFNIKTKIVEYRLRNGWDIEKAFTTPSKGCNKA